MIVPVGLEIQDGNKSYKAGADAPSKFDKMIEKKTEAIAAKAKETKAIKDKLKKDADKGAKNVKKNSEVSDPSKKGTEK